MSKFTEGYFTMNEDDALEYAITELGLFNPESMLSCKEIGDGNLNYVFRIIDANSGEAVIIKQAGPIARISDDFKLSPDRNRIESDILKIQHTLAEGFVPVIFKYDSVMNCTVMEDLSDHKIMRAALHEHKKFPLFAEHIATFMANTLLLNSDVVLDHKEKKQLVKNFINPELCEITENLVYTEPFYDCERNDVTHAIREFALKELWSDDKLLLETAKLKFEFMNNAQTLVHGDLHTGSIFIKEDSTKIIDPEFAFYGPAGYDVGNVIANLIFAYENAEARIENPSEREEYKSWLGETIVDVVDLFKMKFNNLWKERVTEQTAAYTGFQEYYLNSIIRDSAAVAGCELIRRIIGLAHVKDITEIEDPKQRERAEKICLSVGKKFILERHSFREGKDFINIVNSIEKIII